MTLSEKMTMPIFRTFRMVARRARHLEKVGGTVVWVFFNLVVGVLDAALKLLVVRPSKLSAPMM